MIRPYYRLLEEPDQDDIVYMSQPEFIGILKCSLPTFHNRMKLDGAPEVYKYHQKIFYRRDEVYYFVQSVFNHERR